MGDAAGGEVGYEGLGRFAEFVGQGFGGAGGTLTLGSTGALQNSTLVYSNQGGALSLGGLTAVILGGLTGTENLALVNTSSAAVALTTN